jgi:hypothetical protein
MDIGVTNLLFNIALKNIYYVLIGINVGQAVLRILRIVL